MNQIGVFGRSIGSGVATNLAFQMRHNPFYCVILKSPYYSIKDVFRSHAGSFGKALVADHFNSASKIAQISAPLLVIHGQGDTLIPVDHGRRLVGLC